MLLRIFIATLLITCYTISHAQDADTTDCFEGFFKSGDQIKNPSKLQLTLKNKKTVSLSEYIKQLQGSQNYSTLKDLDGDGKKELILYSFTGGAHCCDEYYFFNNTSPGKYTFSGKLSGGEVCIDKDTFNFSFTEYYGYFFTCYACAFPGEEDHPGYQYPGGVSLLYKNGKVYLQPGDNELKQRINKNLSILSKLKWDGGAGGENFDDGRRKEVAMNLATYFFSFGKNLTDTKALFTKYYKFKDATKVWTEFATTLKYLQTNNNF